MATAAASLLTLAATNRAQWPVTLRVRHGSQSAVVEGSFGKTLSWPYDGADYPPEGRVFFLPRFDMAGVDFRPREGTIVVDQTTEQTYELVPFGTEPPVKWIHAEEVYKLHALETTNSPRRGFLVDVEIPDPDATRASSGNKDKTAYTVAPGGDDVPCDITATGGTEEVRGGKLVLVRSFEVRMAARSVRGSARLRVKGGWLREDYVAAAADPDNPGDGPYLYCKVPSRESSAGLESLILCEMAGG